MNKEHPILFSSEMVRAILDGRKSMTRRIIKDRIMLELTDKCPYGNIGDYLWVRETFQYVDFCGPEDNGYVYKATDPDWDTMDEWTWKPSIFMPKEACRIWLQITDIKVERLQDISEDDANLEGINIRYEKDEDGLVIYDNRAKEVFEELWKSIHGEESWNQNPWVWVISFSKINKP